MHVRSQCERTAPPSSWSRALTTSMASVPHPFVLARLWFPGELCGEERVVERLFVRWKRVRRFPQQWLFLRPFVLDWFAFQANIVEPRFVAPLRWFEENNFYSDGFFLRPTQPHGDRRWPGPGEWSARRTSSQGYWTLHSPRRQPRSVTWLLRALSSSCRRWRVATISTAPPSGTSSRRSSRGGRCRRRRRGGSKRRRRRRRSRRQWFAHGWFCW